MNDQDLWQLNIIGGPGPGAGGHSPLSGQTSLGTSSDNHIQLSDPYVAPHHATITRNGPGQYYIAGISGGSPVYVNGQAINASTWLQSGDYIQLVGVQFQVVAVPQPTAVQPGAVAKKSRTPLVLAGIGAGCLGLILCGALIAFGLPYLNRADDTPESGAKVPSNQATVAQAAVFTAFDQLNQELSQAIAELNQAQLRFIDRTSQAAIPSRVAAKQLALPSLDDVLKEIGARAAHVAQVAGQLAEMTANDPETSNSYKNLARFGYAHMLEAQTIRQELEAGNITPSQAGSQIAEYGARLWNPQVKDAGGSNSNPFIPHVADPAAIPQAQFNGSSPSIGETGEILFWQSQSNSQVTKEFDLPAPNDTVPASTAPAAPLNSFAGQADPATVAQAVAAELAKIDPETPGSGPISISIPEAMVVATGPDTANPPVLPGGTVNAISGQKQPDGQVLQLEYSKGNVSDVGEVQELSQAEAGSLFDFDEPASAPAVGEAQTVGDDEDLFGFGEEEGGSVGEAEEVDSADDLFGFGSDDGFIGSGDTGGGAGGSSNSGSSTSCNLTPEEQQASVELFAELMPVFKHPRCSNCHGAFADLHTNNSTAHPGGRVSNDECFYCHSQAPISGLTRWHLPVRTGPFNSQSAGQICMQIKAFHSSAGGFVSHIETDTLIGLAFAGERAGANSISGNPAQPPSMNRAEFASKAQSWAESFGAWGLLGQWPGGADSPCGCATVETEPALAAASLNLVEVRSEVESCTQEQDGHFFELTCDFNVLVTVEYEVPSTPAYFFCRTQVMAARSVASLELTEATGSATLAVSVTDLRKLYEDDDQNGAADPPVDDGDNMFTNPERDNDGVYAGLSCALGEYDLLTASAWQQFECPHPDSEEPGDCLAPWLSRADAHAWD